MCPYTQGREIKCKNIKEENVSNGIKSQGHIQRCVYGQGRQDFFVVSFCKMKRKKLRTDAN